MNLLEFIKKPVTSNELLSIVDRSIHDKKEVVIETQKKQWKSGEDNEGNIIGRYKRSTEMFAKEPPFPNTPKIAGKPYNLNWSGDLIKKTFIETKQEPKDIAISVDSKGLAKEKLFDTIKTHGLISNPKTIFGVQQDNLNEVTKAVNEDSLKKLKKRYGM